MDLLQAADEGAKVVVQFEPDISDLEVSQDVVAVWEEVGSPASGVFVVVT